MDVLIVIKSKKIITLFSFIIFFVLSSTFITSVGADYNIKKGDTFKFEILTLRNPWGFIYNLHIKELVFTEGVKMTIKFTDVDPLDVDFTITISGKTENGNPFFDNIIVQNRNWEELTERYENQGYNITETNDLWMLRQNNLTIIEADYSKKTGVLTRFYAFNESQLISILNAGEVEIIRLTPDSIGNNWAYSFLVLWPLIVIAVYLFQTYRIPGKKPIEDLEKDRYKPQKPVPQSQVSVGYVETSKTIVSGKMVKIQRELVETPDGLKWKVTNLETNETWFMNYKKEK